MIGTASVMPWRALAALCVVVGLAVGQVALLGLAHRSLVASAVKAEHDRIALEQAAATAEATREAQRIEQARVEAASGVDRERVKTEARLRAAADGARAELERLRIQLAAATAAVPGDPAASGVADGAATVGGLLGACAGRYAGVAGDAGALAAQVSGLQRYVTEVCR